jgi:transposase
VACACGRVHRAPAPAGAGAAGTLTYGLLLQAWCVYLIVAHAIPVHRCAEPIVPAPTETPPMETQRTCTQITLTGQPFAVSASS